MVLEPGRQVVIPPRAVEGFEPPNARLRTSLTRQQVENSPAADTARPVSRQYEIDLYAHYA